jgi:hypothetical protein
MAKREEEEKELFTVSDRRKFTSEGERRDDELPASESRPDEKATVLEEREPSPAEAAALKEETPLPPSAEEQQQQHGAYQDANQKLDSMLDQAGAKRPPDAEVSFERLIASLYMQAMLQLGLVREETAPMRPDIIGARQTIDTIALLAEKTKGNLSSREEGMLTNVIFELRMAYVEITKMITQAPPPGKDAKK